MCCGDVFLQGGFSSFLFMGAVVYKTGKETSSETWGQVIRVGQSKKPFVMLIFLPGFTFPVLTNCPGTGSRMEKFS